MKRVARPDSGGRGAVPAVDAELNEAVDQALLGMAYDRLRQSIVLTVIVCVVFIVLFWSFFPFEGKVIWIACLLSVAAARAVLWIAHRRAVDPSRAYRRWQALFFATAVAAGLSWAVGPVLLMPPAGYVESMLLVLAALSVGAVSMSAMNAQMTAMLSFQFCILAPTVLALAATGGAVERMAAAVVFAGMVSLMIVGRASSRATRSLLESDLRLSRSIAETVAARERAEAASQAKTRFLANMSHELRSPLNAVIGAAQLLRAGDRDAQSQAELVDAIQRSGTNLLGLIDNVLDLSRIEAGEHTLSIADFDLRECLDGALATAGLAAHAKGLDLQCVVDPGVPLWRRGDAAGLRQVLLNLLGNAVKFTQRGTVVVNVCGTRQPLEVCFTIRDTGVGIGSQSIDHIFEPFRQGDDSTVRRFGGSGLGLTIVRQLTQAMGGQVSVTSTPDVGSEFRLVLPLLMAQSGSPASQVCAGTSPSGRARRGGVSQDGGGATPPSAPTGGPRLAADGTKAHILLAEDDAINSMIVGRMLKHAGYRVTLAADGRSALDQLRVQAFDLVLMDWQMPGMDGLQATREMRTGQAGAAAIHVPVVALTANAFAEDREACLQAGMNDYLTKPVQIASLIGTIERWTARDGSDVRDANATGLATLP